ncbi:hypothetical protein UJS69_10575, partial [Streptococcus agalactiae]
VNFIIYLIYKIYILRKENMMRKYIKWLIPISIFGMILGGCQMNSEHKSQSNEVKNSKQSAVKKGKKVIKKEQVAYLKKHEKELTEYVKIQILVKLSMIGIVCA